MKINKAIAAKLLNKGIDYYNLGEWNRALECWEKAKEVYKELGDKQGILNALNNIGIVYKDTGEWGQALEYYKKSLAISEELGDKQGISNALNNIGIVYKGTGEWGQALDYYKKSLAISEELGDKQGILNSLNNIGIVCQDTGEWGQALEYYKKSLAISEELGDKQGIINALNNIGAVCQDTGEWGQALEYYKKSLAISEELGNKQGISIALNNIGVVCQDTGEWGQALEYYKKSLAISEELGDKQGISDVLNNIGEINIKNGNLDEAKNNLEKSLSITETLSPISTVNAIANLSELQGIDDLYSDAFATLKKALQIVVDTGAKPQEIGIHEKLADIHINKYIADKDKDDLAFAEALYNQAFELAKSMKMSLQQATAIRGIGIVQGKKEDVTASKESFKKSIEILCRLGATFELQKTSLEYAKALYENNYLLEAELVAKSAAFDALRNDYREPLAKAYLLLGDIAMRQGNQYRYYLDALKTAEFNPKIYVKTCFLIIFRMKNMEKQTLLKFIESLKKINKDKSFDSFLNVLNAKVDGKVYDTSGLPNSLIQEIKGLARY